MGMNVCNNCGMTVYDSLRTMVLSGALKPDVRISESELAEELKVSRTPIREALQRLEADRLVFAQGRGIRARILHEDELLHVYEARAALDGFAAAHVATLNAAGEIASARFAELSGLANDANSFTRALRLDEATQSNRNFHQAIAVLAGNPVIVETLNGYWDQIIVSTRGDLHQADRASHVHAEHDAILAAIMAGNGVAASSAASAHSLNTRHILTR